MRGLLCVLLLGCATGGAAGDGDTDLPNRGFVPYEEVRDADDRLVRVLDVPHEAPCAVVEGAALWLYSASCVDEVCSIERARTEDGLSFEPPETVMEGARAPHVVRAGGEWRMAYVDAEGRIGVARGDGRTFHGAVTALSGEAPSLAGEHLYFVREAAVWRAGADGTGARQVMTGGEGCTDADGAPEKCWDAEGVADAEVRLAETATGRVVYRMVYTATGGGLGFAASADGVRWSRFAFNPLLDKASDGTNVRFGDRYALYFAAGGSEPYVAAAFNDPSAPSESF